MNIAGESKYKNPVHVRDLEIMHQTQSRYTLSRRRILMLFIVGHINSIDKEFDDESSRIAQKWLEELGEARDAFETASGSVMDVERDAMERVVALRHNTINLLDKSRNSAKQLADKAQIVLQNGVDEHDNAVNGMPCCYTIITSTY